MSNRVQNALKAREERKQKESSRVSDALMAYRERKQSSAQAAVSDLATKINAEIGAFKGMSEPSWGASSLQSALTTTRQSTINVDRLSRELDSFKNYIDGDVYDSYSSVLKSLGEGYDSYLSRVEQLSHIGSEGEYKTRKQLQDIAKDYHEKSTAPDWEEMSQGIATSETTPGDYDILFNLSRTRMGYDKEYAIQDGFSEDEWEETERQRAYIEQKYGVDLHADIYDNVNIFNDLMSRVDFISYLTEDEKKYYDYLRNTQGGDAALDFEEKMRSTVDERSLEALVQKNEEFASKNPVGASLVSVLSGSMSGLEHIAGSIEYLQTGEMPMNRSAAATAAIRGTVSELVDWEIGNWDAFDFLYSTAMSGVDSVAASASLSYLGGLSLGLSAAAQGANDALERGMSDGQAFWNGLFTGAFEMIFEEFSIGNLEKLKQIAPDSIKDIFKNLSKTMLVNGTEEMATEVANIAYDTIINGDFANYTWEELKNGAWVDAVLQVVESGASGALMGIGMGGVGTAYSASRIMEQNAQIKSIYGGAQQELVAQGLESAEGSESHDLALKYQAMLEKGKNLRGGQLRRLVAANARAISTEQNEGAQRDSLEDEGGDSAHDAKHSMNAEQYGRMIEELAQGEQTAQSAPHSEAQDAVHGAESAEGQTVTVEQNAAQAKPTAVTEHAEAVSTESGAVDRDNQTVETIAPMAVEDESVPTARNADTEDETVEAASVKYGAQAGAMIHTYAAGQDVARYDDAYGRAYEMGKSGVSLSYAKASEATAYLTEAQRELAWEAGKAASDALAKDRESANIKAANGKSGRRIGAVKGDGVSIDDLKATFNDKQNTAYRLLSTYAEATGIDIVLYKSEAGEDGTYQEAQGKFAWREDTIYIDINAGIFNGSDVGDLAWYTMLRTFSHEFTHFLEKWNPVWYNEFRRVVFDTLTERGVDVTDLIERKIHQGVKGKTDHDAYDAASREVVAEAMTDILPDATFVQTLAEQHKTIFGKLLERLKAFVHELKDYFASLVHNPSSEANALKEQVGEAVHYVESIVKLYDRVALEAVENYQRTVAIEEADPNGLIDDEKGALMAYKSGGSYHLNAKLREGAELNEYEQSVVDNLDRALEKLPTYKGKVYRNIQFDGLGDKAARDAYVAGHIVGEMISYDAYTSASTAIDGYVLEGEYVVHHIIQSTNGRNMDGYGNNSESEVLFARESQYVTDRIEYDQDGTPTIYLMEEAYGQQTAETQTAHRRGTEGSVSRNHSGESRSSNLETDKGEVQRLHSQNTEVGEMQSAVSERNTEGYRDKQEDLREVQAVADRTDARGDAGALPEVGDGRGIPAENEESRRDSGQTVHIRSGQRGVKQDQLCFSDDAFITPKAGTAEAEEYAKLAAYGIEGYVVKKSAWTKSVQAFANSGRIYIREGLDEQYRGVVVAHEATHVMKQLQFQPYLEFLERTPELIDVTSDFGSKLYERPAKHYGIDVFDNDPAKISKLYDEINATVYGSYVGGQIVGDILESVQEAFYDFNAYIRELDAIHEQFKAENSEATVKEENLYVTERAKNQETDIGRTETGIYERESGAREIADDRPRVQSELGENEESVRENRSAGGQHRGLNSEASSFNAEDYIAPERDSSLHKMQVALTHEYGVECYIVKESAWKRSAPACAYGGKVYISAGINEETLSTVIPHETNHVMKQMEFKPYLNFIDATPDYIDFSGSQAAKLFDIVSNHRVVDIFAMSEKQRFNFYDELNAIVYGITKSGIIDDADFDYKWLSEAFYDFNAYIQALDTIHEKFKVENTQEQQMLDGSDEDIVQEQSREYLNEYDNQGDDYGREENSNVDHRRGRRGGAAHDAQGEVAKGAGNGTVADRHGSQGGVLPRGSGKALLGTDSEGVRVGSPILRKLNQGDKDDGKNSQDTEVLGERVIPAAGGSRNGVWQQGENPETVYQRLADSQNDKGSHAVTRAGSSGWLERRKPAQGKQSDVLRFGVGILRNVRRRSVSLTDTAGRDVPPHLQKAFADTIFKDDAGRLLSLYHWTDATFRVFANGDIGFHFGTLDAAYKRYQKVKDDKIINNSFYKEVYLNITNPATVDFDPMTWDVFPTAYKLNAANIISDFELERLSNLDGFIRSSYDSPAAVELRKMLMDKGIDGIIYRNDFEGDLSVIALNAEQIYTVAENGNDVGKVQEQSRAYLKPTATKYSYDWFVSKPNMVVTSVDDTVTYRGSADRKQLIDQAVVKAGRVGSINQDGNAVIRVADTDTDVIVSKNGLRHSIDRRLNVIAPVISEVGNILKNAIRLNELSPRTDEIQNTYVLIGAAKNKKNEPYIASFVVNRYSGEVTDIDVLYAVNTKKEPAALLPKITDDAATPTDSVNSISHFQKDVNVEFPQKKEPAGIFSPSLSVSNTGYFTGSEISIAHLLEYVNRYFADILPEDVLRHFGHKARPDGVIGQDALYQQRPPTLSDREVLALAKDTIQVDELSDGERDALRIFNERLDKLEALEVERREAGKKYKEQQFGAKVDRDAAFKTLILMQVLDAQIQQANADILYFKDKKVLRQVLQKARRVVELKTREHDYEAFNRWRDRRNNAALIKKYRTRITKDVKDISDWLVKPDNKDIKKHVPDVVKDAVIPFIESIDFTSKQQSNRGKPTKEDETFENLLSKLKAVMEKGVGEGRDIEQVYAGYDDLPPDFIDKLRDLTEAVEQSTQHEGEFAINRMTSEELKTLASVVKNIKAQIQQINRFHANQMFQKVSEAGDSSIAFMASMAAANPAFTVQNTVSDFVYWNNIRPAYAFERFGDGGKAIYDGLRRGMGRLAFNTQKITQFAEKTFSPEQVKKWSREKITVKTSFGEISMPVSVAMSFYELSKQEDSLRHILGGGIRVAAYKDNGRLINDERHGMTEADVAAIVGALSEEQKKIADALQQFMEQVGGEWGNYVSVRRFGEKMFGIEHYFPISTDGQLLALKAEKAPDNASLYALLNMSFTKSRNEAADTTVVLYDIFDVFSNHMAGMAQYNALALPVLDAVRWFNYQQVTYPMLDEKPVDWDENYKKYYKYDTKDYSYRRINDSKAPAWEPGTFYKREVVSTVREQMKRVYGVASRGESRASNFVLNILKDFNGTAAQGSPYDKKELKLLHNANLARVSFNLRVLVQQPFSIVRAGNILSVGALRHGVLDWGNIKHNTDEMLKHSGIAVWKSLGFYDVNVSRSVTQLIKQESTWIEKTAELGLKGAEKADTLTWAGIWSACKYEVVHQKGIKSTDDGFFDAVTELFEDVIYRTQVVDSVLTKSEVMRDTGAVARLTSSFMGEPTTTVSGLIGAYDQFHFNRLRGMSFLDAWRQGGCGKKLMRTFAVYAVSQTVIAFIESLIDALRDDDEYETYPEKLWEAFWGDDSFLDGNLLQELNLLNKLPKIKEFFEIVKGLIAEGFSIDGVLAQLSELPLADAFDAAKSGLDILSDIWSGDETDYTVWGGIYKWLQAFSGVSALPVSSVARDGLALYNGVICPIWNETIGAMAPSLHLDKVKTYDAGDRANIKYAYLDGHLTADEAMDELLAKGLADDEDEAYFIVQEWDAGGDYSRYGRVYDAILNGGDFDAAMRELIAHGYTEEHVIAQVKSQIGTWYSNPESDIRISKQQAIAMLDRYTDLNDDAITTQVNKWSSRVVTGIAYDKIDDEYEAGRITVSRAIEMYMRYGGLTRAQAGEKIAVIDFLKSHPSIDTISYSAIESYTEHCMSVGIDADVFMQVWKYKNEAEADKDKKGNPISGSKKIKVLDCIDSLDLSRKQKDALYRALGYAESQIGDAPWR